MKSIFSPFIVSFVVASCAPLRTNQESFEAGKAPKKLVERDRIEAIKKASVWNEGWDEKISNLDLRSGPEHPLFNKPGQEIECEFVEPDSKDLPGGRTPKFDCQLPFKGKMKTFKVKYDSYYNAKEGKGANRNLEVYGEVLSTRLMWALGFPADNIYTVRVRCKNCPVDPWLYIRKELNIFDVQDKIWGWFDKGIEQSGSWKEGRGDRVFDPAVIEVKFSGDAIALDDVKGWDWNELFEHMDNPAVQKPQREALTILMAFINHMDNKSEQQRLSCRKDSWDGYDCKEPVLLVQDAGSNFGNGWAPLQGDLLNKVSLDKWLAVKVWSDKKKCLLNINALPNGSLKGRWPVSEEGRLFLANLMKKLTEKQIVDLFTVARISMSGKEVEIRAWVKGFMEKMNREVINTSCGN